jgi:hypothetical protein
VQLLPRTGGWPIRTASPTAHRLSTSSTRWKIPRCC